MCGVGSDQIIDIITKTFLDKGDKALVLSPSFAMYKISTKVNHGEVEEIALDENFEIDKDAIIEKVNALGKTDILGKADAVSKAGTAKIKILFLCTPNNPTGNSISLEDTKEIIGKSNCIVVVDEAYAEFSKESIIPYLNNYNNLIVLRTFSKAYGLAGLRIGYAISSEEIINAMAIVKPPFNLSNFAEIAATEVLKDSEEYKRRIDIIVKNRDNLKKELSKLDFLRVYDSDSNFLYIESQREIAAPLEKKGILIRKFESSSPVEKVRVSVGDEETNKFLVECLKDLMD